jgi:hypothetical protein
LKSKIEYVDPSEVPQTGDGLFAMIRQCPEDRVVKVSKKDFTAKKVQGVVSSIKQYYRRAYRVTSDKDSFFIAPIKSETALTGQVAKPTAKAARLERKMAKRALKLKNKKDGIIRVLPGLFYTEALLKKVRQLGSIRIAKRAFRTTSALHAFVYSTRNAGFRIDGTEKGSRVIGVRQGGGVSTNPRGGSNKRKNAATTTVETAVPEVKLEAAALPAQPQAATSQVVNGAAETSTPALAV